MKKILILVFMFSVLVGYSQKVSDATIKTYGDTYLNTNNVGSITGAQLNTYLNYMISSKVNHDSATVVRIATTKDSLFITYYGYTEDTILLAAVGDSSLWSIGSDITYSKNSGAVRITAGDLYPSADGTYDLGTSSYGWDTLFLSSVIEYGSDLVFSYSGTKMKLTTGGNLGIGDNSPDSAISTTGGEFTTDILIGGGWQTWVPTIAWTSGGGQPSAPDIVIARYIVVNNAVTYVITFYGTNDSGAGLTAMTVTLPYTPKDVNAYVDAGGHCSVNSKVTPSGAVYSYVDAADGTPANRKIIVPGFTLANTDDYIFNFTGTYEITGK